MVASLSFSFSIHFLWVVIGGFFFFSFAILSVVDVLRFVLYSRSHFFHAQPEHDTCCVYVRAVRIFFPRCIYQLSGEAHR
jgi:hypothetical protein